MKHISHEEGLESIIIPPYDTPQANPLTALRRLYRCTCKTLKKQYMVITKVLDCTDEILFIPNGGGLSRFIGPRRYVWNYVFHMTEIGGEEPEDICMHMDLVLTDLINIWNEGGIYSAIKGFHVVGPFCPGACEFFRNLNPLMVDLHPYLIPTLRMHDQYEYIKRMLRKGNSTYYQQNYSLMKRSPALSVLGNDDLLNYILEFIESSYLLPI